MCGRYAVAHDAADLVEEFGVDRAEIGDGIGDGTGADYNVAPTKPVYAVLERAPKDQPAAKPERQLRVVRWGLVPSWAKDISIGNRLVNARAETLAEKPSFRRAFAARRCLLPADGYYEWYTEEPREATGLDGRAATSGKADKPRKQPYFIRPEADGEVLALAGLYELWRDPAAPDGEGWLWTCTIITTQARDELGRIHDRMPMIVDRANWAAWLDPRRSAPGDVAPLLVPATPDRLIAYPVSTAVNNVRNNGPDLVRPLACG